MPGAPIKLLAFNGFPATSRTVENHLYALTRPLTGPVLLGGRVLLRFLRSPDRWPMNMASRHGRQLELGTRMVRP